MTAPLTIQTAKTHEKLEDALKECLDDLTSGPFVVTEPAVLPHDVHTLKSIAACVHATIRRYWPECPPIEARSVGIDVCLVGHMGEPLDDVLEPYYRERAIEKLVAEVRGLFERGVIIESWCDGYATIFTVDGIEIRAMFDPLPNSSRWILKIGMREFVVPCP